MSIAGDLPVDEVAVVFGWMRRLCEEETAAEEWTVEVLRRYQCREGPRWLQRRDGLLRLRYFAAKVVLERRAES